MYSTLDIDGVGRFYLQINFWSGFCLCNRAKFGIEEMCRDQWTWASKNPHGYDGHSSEVTSPSLKRTKSRQSGHFTHSFSHGKLITIWSSSLFFSFLFFSFPFFPHSTIPSNLSPLNTHHIHITLSHVVTLHIIDFETDWWHIT